MSAIEATIRFITPDGNDQTWQGYLSMPVTKGMRVVLDRNPHHAVVDIKHVVLYVTDDGQYIEATGIGQPL